MLIQNHWKYFQGMKQLFSIQISARRQRETSDIYMTSHVSGPTNVPVLFQIAHEIPVV